MPTFEDRGDAGRRLAERMRDLVSERPILLGLARGGVPVAAAAAAELGVELDALVVRKVAPPGDREYGIGAVAPHGIVYKENSEVAEAQIEDARREMRRRIDAYLGGRPDPSIEGRVAVMVDDGLATGATAIAAARYARTLKPRRLLLAVPVLSDEALRAMTPEVAAVLYLEKPTPFHAVGDAYASFDEVTDEDVKRALS